MIDELKRIVSFRKISRGWKNTKYMPATNLKNITIDERQTINGETFFIITDNENNQSFLN